MPRLSRRGSAGGSSGGGGALGRGPEGIGAVMVFLRRPARTRPLGRRSHAPRLYGADQTGQNPFRGPRKRRGAARLAFTETSARDGPRT
nr:hypothetical protein GCM10020241_51610 [Streptoalloteichus tenebrarius]